MVRKLALAVSLALGTLSVPVHALGLGELSTKSTLNQNFQGDITLLSVEPEELDGVRVRLADQEAFTRAGVDRPFYLSLLRFEPALSSSGKPVIRVTSEFPIREPFMNFLVEVNWPQGRLLREYTVLLDPPTTTRRRPPAVAPVAKAAAPQPAVSAPAQPATPPTTVAPASTAPGEYGPVKANETAWSIAKKLRPAGVSMEQMMMALLNANPQAFLDSNINRLRRGQILRVPTVGEIRELSRQEARAAYRQQQDEWLARRDQKLQQAAQAESPAEPEAAAETGAATGAAEAAQPDDRLRIATARPEGTGEAGAGDDDALSPTATDLTSRLLVARENAETSRQEAETLRSRVEELQTRLQDMQRLLSLKDDQLAQLQDRVATGQPGLAGEVTETSVAEETAPGAAPEAEAEPVLSETAPAPAEEVSDTADTAPAAEPVVADATLADQVDAAAETVSEAVVEPRAAWSPGPDYRIAEIPPQVDPDRIVAASDAEGVVPAGVIGEDAVEQPEVGEVPLAEAPAPGEGETVVIEEAPETVPGWGTTVIAEGEPGPVEQPIETPEPVVAAESGDAEPTAQTTGSDGLIPAPLLKMLEQNMVPVAAGGVAVLGLLGWLMMRGRRKPGDEEPAPAAAPAAAGTAAAAGAALAGGDEAQSQSQAKSAAESDAVDKPAVDADVLNELPDSAFLDDLDPNEINALQDETGEVDPVSEADVYIAYGRYRQAEELLRQALKREPERVALRHKLLEVHYATRDGEAFAALAQEMVDAGHHTLDPAAWARAQDMGRELAPDNPLFSRSEAGTGGAVAASAAGAAGGIAAAVADLEAEVDTELKAEVDTELEAASDLVAEAESVDHDTLSLEELEMSELSAAYAEENTGSNELEAPSEVSITLDLEEASELDRPTEMQLPESIPLEDFEGMDAELPAAGQAVAEEVLDETFDLEHMMAEAEAAVDRDDATVNTDSEFSAAELQAQLDELSDLSLLDSEFDETVDISETKVPGNLGLVAEDTGAAVESVDEPFSLDSELTLDEDEVGEEIPEFLAAQNDEGGEDVLGEDEVTTKLDLARAYFEMGDADGARSILQEVVVEGNDSQRGDAEQLLAKMG